QSTAQLKISCKSTKMQWYKGREKNEYYVTDCRISDKLLLRRALLYICSPFSQFTRQYHALPFLIYFIEPIDALSN
ncbi:MAG TPA: hypothetical protein VN958_19930, partial [Chitinophagaceae bacterium]|nr:hypothetical protein [Chitinophagaceae bacterium]